MSNSSAEGGSNSSSSNNALNPMMELSFEYLMAKDTLQWITICSEHAMLMSVCLQSIVDELLSQKVGHDLRHNVETVCPNISILPNLPHTCTGVSNDTSIVGAGEKNPTNRANSYLYTTWWRNLQEYAEAGNALHAINKFGWRRALLGLSRIFYVYFYHCRNV